MMFIKIYNILTDFLGESKQGYYSKDVEQYQFNCPCCRDENCGVSDMKYNLEINVKKLRFHCWKCGDTNGMKGTLSYLVKRYGGIRNYNTFKNEVEYLIRSKMYDLSLFRGKTQTELITQVSLPLTFQKISLKNCTNNKLLVYLRDRKLTQDIIDKFKIGSTNYNEKNSTLKNRIIIPSYDEYGDLNYWVGRDFTGFQKKMKYKNCDAEKNEIIYQESLINYDADIILCEGAIDCLYGNNFISLLGKSLHKKSKLYEDLINKANAKIIICLDADTDISETKRIYNLLNVSRLKNKIWYIRLNKFKDFGEIYQMLGKIGIINAIRTMKQFNELELFIS